MGIEVKTVDKSFVPINNGFHSSREKAQLFIHIGTQKTGTTSIQRVLHQYRNERPPDEQFPPW